MAPVVTRDLRKLVANQYVPILGLKVNVSAGDQARAAEAAMNDFIANPIESDLCFATVLRCLECGRSTAQAAARRLTSMVALPSTTASAGTAAAEGILL